jgi:hypothetical protein
MVIIKINTNDIGKTKNRQRRAVNRKFTPKANEQNVGGGQQILINNSKRLANLKKAVDFPQTLV